MRARPARCTLDAVAAFIACFIPICFGSGAGGLEFKYVFRPGDSWRERIAHKVELSEGEGHSYEATEQVEVLSVREDGSAVLRRRRICPEGADAPLEVELSARGEVLSFRRAGSELKDIVGRYWPVLPEAPLKEGATCSRPVKGLLPGGLSWQEEETATLVELRRGPLGGRTAVLRLERRWAPPPEGRVEFELGALLAPEAGALRALPRKACVLGELRGSSAEGELLFDVSSGRLISYRMDAALGLAGRLRGGSGTDGAISMLSTLRVSMRIERLRRD